WSSRQRGTLAGSLTPSEPIICLRFARGLSKAGADDRGLALAQLRRTRHADGGRYGLANWATNPPPWRAMRPAAFRLLESWVSRRSLASAGVPFSLPGPQSSPIRRDAIKTADTLHTLRLETRPTPSGS